METKNKWAEANESQGSNEIFFKFKEIGEELEGLLTGKKLIKDTFGNENVHFIIENLTGKFLTPPNSSMIKKMSIVPIGSEIKITYLGEIPLDNGKTVKDYRVLWI